MTLGSLFVGSQPIRVASRVVHDSRFMFTRLVQRKQTNAIVLHWTGGSNLAPEFFETLTAKGYSIHLLIEPDGTVYQMADLNRRCVHAGSADDSDGDGQVASANANTIGIEIVNPANQREITNGVRREIVTEKIHGTEVAASAFTDAQVAAALDLVSTICLHYRLPIRVPMLGDDVLTTTMNEHDFAAFRGVLGHFHITRRKRDPGLALMRAVAALPYRPRV